MILVGWSGAEAATPTSKREKNWFAYRLFPFSRSPFDNARGLWRWALLICFAFEVFCAASSDSSVSVRPDPEISKFQESRMRLLYSCSLSWKMTNAWQNSEAPMWSSFSPLGILRAVKINRIDSYVTANFNFFSFRRQK